MLLQMAIFHPFLWLSNIIVYIHVYEYVYTYTTYSSFICWWTLENSMEVPLKKTKIELLYELAIPFLGIYPEKMKTWFEKILPNVRNSISPTPIPIWVLCTSILKGARECTIFFLKPIQEACGILVSKQELNRDPQQWECNIFCVCVCNSTGESATS